MGRILLISSLVTRGHVGLSGILPILQLRGLDTIALPTVLLSNHHGHAHAAGSALPVGQLNAMLAALDANGWLGDVAAVLTGYFPTADHVAFAREAIETVRSRNPTALVFCDPVLGDTPQGLYVPEAVATAVRRDLVGLSQCLTPNRFELQWLSGCEVGSCAEAVAAARRLGVPTVLATSIPAGAGWLATVAVTREAAVASRNTEIQGVPHGAGDVLAALFLVEQMRGHDVPTSLALAIGALDAIIAGSVGTDELRLVATRERWMAPTPTAVAAI